MNIGQWCHDHLSPSLSQLRGLRWAWAWAWAYAWAWAWAWAWAKNCDGSHWDRIIGFQPLIGTWLAWEDDLDLNGYKLDHTRYHLGHGSQDVRPLIYTSEAVICIAEKHCQKLLKGWKKDLYSMIPIRELKVKTSSLHASIQTGNNAMPTKQLQ